MRSILTILGLVFSSLTVMAVDYKDLEISGFKVIESTESVMRLSFRGEKPFVLSKLKFTIEESAKEFCKKNELILDAKGFEKTLLLAMSGAASLNEEIKQAITFKLDDSHQGISAWTGANDQVEMMWDGRGSGTEVHSMKELARVAEKTGNLEAASVAAICD